MRIMVIDGEPGSSDVCLRITADGELEIEKRVEKIVCQLTELSMAGLEESLRFYRTKHEALAALIEPLVKAHILAELKNAVGALDKTECERITAAWKESGGKIGDTDGLTDEDVKAGARRDGTNVVYPDGKCIPYRVYKKMITGWATEKQQAGSQLLGVKTEWLEKE